MMIRFSRVLLGIAFMVSAALWTISAAATNGPAFSVVYPTGVFPDDVTNIRAAVLKGGIVFLKASNKSGVPTAFNFSTDLQTAGPSGYVELTTDVSIIGEHIGNHRATISGGFDPIFCARPVKISIQGLDFEAPFDDAILILSSSGADVIDNVVHNVAPIEVQVPSGRIITFADGIDFLGGGDVTAITGKVRIIGNTIDGLGAVFSNGVQFDTVGAESELTGNTVKNVNSAVTEQGSGLGLYRVQKPILVADNYIAIGPSQTSDADGISLAADLGIHNEVLGNSIFTDGANGDGIDVSDTVNVLVAGNHVTNLNAINSATIGLFNVVTHSLIAENDLHGTSYAAVYIGNFGDPTQIASFNRFLDNRLENYTSVEADVYFDVNAQDNMYIGQCQTFIDLGVGNTSTCGEPPSSYTSAPSANAIAAAEAPATATPGTHFHAAMQAKLAALQMHASTPHPRSNLTTLPPQ
jgi:hypothetical protein